MLEHLCVRRERLVGVVASPRIVFLVAHETRAAHDYPLGWDPCLPRADGRVGASEKVAYPSSSGETPFVLLRWRFKHDAAAAHSTEVHDLGLT